MTLRPGDCIERYTVLAHLGRGGMGQVYRARDTRLQRIVALKVLHDDDGASTSASRSTGGGTRILREARAAAALAHPNVVAIHDVGEADAPDGRRIAYLAMELVDGESLRVHVGAGAPPDERAIAERTRIVTDIARALQAAHAIGLVHRDIKPENVMIRTDGAVKVLDFGIAKRVYAIVDPTSTTEALVLSTLTSHAASAGTPYYMAPEQMRGEELDGRADQFAWGVVAYELLSGKPCWGAELDALQLVSAVLSTDPEPLDRVDPRISPRVARVVARAMAKSRAERFASMGDVIAALEGKEIAASPLAYSVESVPLALAAPHAAVHPTPGREATEPARNKSEAGARRVRVALAVASAIVGIAGIAAFVRSRTEPANATHDAAPSTASGACLTNAACTEAAGGAASVCRAGACAVLASVDCVVHADASALASEDTVWLGAMLPPKNDPAADGEAELRAVDLARQDFDQTMSGFARARGDAHVHPFGVVACNDGGDAMRAARHLVDDVHVPAIIGFRTAAELIDVGSALLVPRGVVGVASLSTSPLVTSLPNRRDQPRLVWRTTYSSAETARAMGHVVPELLEPKIRALPGVLSAAAPMRVGFARLRSPAGATFGRLLFDALRFNGKSALENGSDYRDFVIDPSDPAKLDDEVARLVQALDRFAPHVIVFVADPAERIVAALEKTWSHARHRPRYLLMTGATEALLRWMGASADRRRRFFGLMPSSTTSVNAQFVMHYNEAADTKVTRTFAPNSSYDAFYVLAYATYALGDQPVTGPNIARAIARLVPPGKPVDVGPSQIFAAYETLRAGGNIDLNGATGSLDFDVATGEAPFDHSVLCVGLGDDGKAAESIESGLVFKSKESRLEGTMSCP